MVAAEGGGVYLIGSTGGTVAGIPVPGCVVGIPCSYVARYEADGAFTWAIGFSNEPDFEAVTVDASGNVYVVGHFSDPVDFGEGTTDPAGLADILLLSVDPSGTRRWTRTFGGIGNEEGLAVAVSRDSVAFGGYFESDVLDVGGEPLDNPSGFPVPSWLALPPPAARIAFREDSGPREASIRQLWAWA